MAGWWARANRWLKRGSPMINTATVTSFFLNEVLWVVIIAGWIVLLVAGLEPDKPLSGGIPGHVDLAAAHNQLEPEGLFGRLGEIGAWVGFIVGSIGLIFILI